MTHRTFFRRVSGFFHLGTKEPDTIFFFKYSYLSASAILKRANLKTNKNVT